ncbi:TenA family protein [Kingella potus]|uniref:TenA family protein n=1 Tax=Kingella potus TaxID=265175 RepID=UPI001FD48BD9|nr:TenA family protein [Kingella potus]UOP01275.1 TenA family protein [Kingella potus]
MFLQTVPPPSARLPARRCRRYNCRAVCFSDGLSVPQQAKQEKPMSALQRFTAESAAEWRAYTEHGFVRALTDGTLPPECFRHYLKQDYLFLHQYARALALGMYKSGSFGEIRALQQSLNAILEETLLHVGFCAEWGLGEDELLREPESAACVAYTRYVLDCGMKGTLADLYAALAPCVIGYAEIGTAVPRWKAGRAIPIRHG